MEFREAKGREAKIASQHPKPFAIIIVVVGWLVKTWLLWGEGSPFRCVRREFELPKTKRSCKYIGAGKLSINSREY